ncbi:MAG: S1 RNA-binding domain-containing protein, partial [Planctomycetota bacterium]
IVVSRRRLIEEERRSSKEKIMAEIEVSQLRKGVVKNISDFGVFVDLGGVDGLLHISDLSWGRISHPSEVVKLDQEIECVVIGVDKDEEKISLGLKQKTPSPWENVENRYPVGARVKGTVVNIMNYGAFIRLEEGIEGLVHISEMSWTKRLSHPSEMLGLNDEIEVVVLNVNKEKREISLGLKQTEINPWTIASQKYPAGTVINTSVRSMTNFGVFVEIEPGIDGMVHISDLSWTKKYNHPSEMLQKGEEVKCVVLDVNEEKRRISLGIKQMTEDPWIRAIPEKYIPGQIIKGTITKLTNFGAFVELEPNLEGLLHISELADHKIDKPQDVVKLGEEVEVKILRIDSESRKIGLSLRRARWAAEEQAAEAQAGEASKSQEPTGEPEKDSDKPTESGEQAAEAVAAEASSEVTESEAQAPEKPQDSAEPGEQAAEATVAEAGSEVAESETQAPEEPQDSAEPTEPTEQAVEAAATDAGSEVAESGPDMAEEPKESAEPEPTEPSDQAVEAQAGEAEEPKEVREPQEGTDEQTEKDAQADERTGGENAAEENAEADTDK